MEKAKDINVEAKENKASQKSRGKSPRAIGQKENGEGRGESHKAEIRLYLQWG